MCVNRASSKSGPPHDLDRGVTSGASLVPHASLAAEGTIRVCRKSYFVGRAARPALGSLLLSLHTCRQRCPDLGDLTREALVLRGELLHRLDQRRNELLIAQGEDGIAAVEGVVLEAAEVDAGTGDDFAHILCNEPVVETGTALAAIMGEV